MQKDFLTKSQALDYQEIWKTNSEKNWTECVKNIITKKPFGDNMFFVFMFIKNFDDALGIKKCFFQPRLTKPTPLPNTTLFQVDPKNPDMLKIIWTLPYEKFFDLYKYKKFCGDSFISECIEAYKNTPEKLLQKEKGQLNNAEIQEIYRCMYGGFPKVDKVPFNRGNFLT